MEFSGKQVLALSVIMLVAGGYTIENVDVESTLSKISDNPTSTGDGVENESYCPMESEVSRFLTENGEYVDNIMDGKRYEVYYSEKSQVNFNGWELYLSGVDDSQYNTDWENEYKYRNIIDTTCKKGSEEGQRRDYKYCALTSLKTLSPVLKKVKTAADNTIASKQLYVVDDMVLNDEGGVEDIKCSEVEEQ